jgi:hypothetical protein
VKNSETPGLWASAGLHKYSILPEMASCGLIFLQIELGREA